MPIQLYKDRLADGIEKVEHRTGREGETLPFSPWTGSLWKRVKTTLGHTHYLTLNENGRESAVQNIKFLSLPSLNGFLNEAPSDLNIDWRGEDRLREAYDVGGVGIEETKRL